MDPNQLRHQAKAKLDAIDAIENSAKAMARSLNAEEQAKIDALTDEATKLSAQADQLETDERDAAKRKSDREQLRGKLGSQPGRKSKADDATAGEIRVEAPNFTKDPMKGFANSREYFRKVVEHGDADPHAASDERLKFLAAAGTDEHSGSNKPYGGFLVPEGMSPDVLSVGNEANPVAGLTTNVPMDTAIVNFNARVDKNHATSVSGGLVVSRKAQTAAQAASRQEYEQVKLEATSLYGFAYAAEELLRDSPRSVAAILEAGFQEEFNAAGIKDFLRGTGVGEPEGVLNSPAKVTVAKEAGQTAATINGTNLVKMRARSWRYSGAVWLANHDSYPQLCTANVAGTNSDVFLFSPARGEDVPDMLLGRPIFFTEFNETLGTEGDIVLVNPSQYLTGTYQPLESAESIHVRFDRHERAFKFWLRNAGTCWWRSALTPNKGANTLSPIVTLAVRA